MKYAFVRANREPFRITCMCQVLQVSRSGYYDWAIRKESEHSERDRVLLKEIRTIHQQMHEAYGAIKTWRTFTTVGNGVRKASGGAASATGGNRSAA